MRLPHWRALSKGRSRIQTTLDLYTDEDLDEMIAAQDKFIDAVGFGKETVQ